MHSFTVMNLTKKYFNFKVLKSSLCLASLLFTSPFAVRSVSAMDMSDMSINVRESSKVNLEDFEAVTNDPVDFKNLSNFAAAPFKLNTATGQVPVQARLRIIVETPLTAKKSELGDDFKARVLEDFYLTGDYKKLIVPKSSWIRGKVSDLKRPRFLSKSGVLEISLDSLVTPQGDYVPLDARLTFVEGVVNKEGLLDPQTGFSNKAMDPTHALLSTKTGQVVSVATLGLPVAGSLLGGSVIALFSRGDSAAIDKGQELQIMITRNVDIAL